MNSLVSALTTIVRTLLNLQNLIVRIGGAHVKHVRESNVVLSAIRSKMGRTGLIRISELNRRFPGVRELLTDSYIIENALLLNGKMETIDASLLRGGHGDYTIWTKVESKLLVNRWDLYLYLSTPTDATDDFPVNGIWITGLN